MKFLLDTHALLWAVEAPERLPSSLRRTLARPEQLPYAVAAISLWEIGMLEAKGRLLLPCPLLEWFRRHVRAPFAEVVPLGPEVAADAVHLPGDFHGDPADRLIVATARSHELTIVTADRRIRAWRHVRSLWE